MCSGQATDGRGAKERHTRNKPEVQQYWSSNILNCSLEHSGAAQLTQRIQSYQTETIATVPTGLSSSG